MEFRCLLFCFSKWMLGLKEIWSENVNLKSIYLILKASDIWTPNKLQYRNSLKAHSKAWDNFW